MVAAWLLGSAAGCSPGNSVQQPKRAIDLSGAAYGRDFALTDMNGSPKRLADFQGKVVMLLFGFTQCPDVCPTALTTAAEALAAIGDDGRQVQVLFVSLDPERDTPEILRAYMATFHRSFVALRGDLERTKETAREFKVSFRKVPVGNSYTIDHTALVYVFDRQGKLRLALHPNQTAREQADDIRPMLAAARSVRSTPEAGA